MGQVDESIPVLKALDQKASITGIKAHGPLIKQELKELTGSEKWPNHAGTIQYSKGTAREIFEAPFHICPATQKLYAAVNWNELMLFKAKELREFKLRYRVSMKEIVDEVGPPQLIGRN